MTSKNIELRGALVLHNARGFSTPYSYSEFSVNTTSGAQYRYTVPRPLFDYGDGIGASMWIFPGPKGTLIMRPDYWALYDYKENQPLFDFQDVDPGRASWHDWVADYRRSARYSSHSARESWVAENKPKRGLFDPDVVWHEYMADLADEHAALRGANGG